MCGRFTLAARPEELLEEFIDYRPPEEPPTPRYNVAPTQQVLVIPNDGSDRMQRMRWGLVPFWAKDVSIGNKLINARSETIAEKPAFRHAFKKKRCLVPADGFYEWKKEGKGKQPYHITVRDGKPFAMAGLWEIWGPKDGEQLHTFTILTTSANDLIQPLHERMPVILPKEAWKAWLDPETPPEALQELLVSYPQEEMSLRPVSTAVNNVRNDSPDCLQDPSEAGPKSAPARPERSTQTEPADV